MNNQRTTGVLGSANAEPATGGQQAAAAQRAEGDGRQVADQQADGQQAAAGNRQAASDQPASGQQPTSQPPTSQPPTSQQATALFVSAFFDELARWGVRETVISPGSRSTALAMTAFEMSRRFPERMRVYVDVDERGASFFALGLAKASGRPVALVCTSGTALANYYPAVMEAETSRVPLVVLSGDRPLRLQGFGAPQTVDQVKAYGDHVRPPGRARGVPFRIGAGGGRAAGRCGRRRGCGACRRCGGRRWLDGGCSGRRPGSRWRGSGCLHALDPRVRDLRRRPGRPCRARGRRGRAQVPPHGGSGAGELPA